MHGEFEEARIQDDIGVDTEEAVNVIIATSIHEHKKLDEQHKELHVASMEQVKINLNIK